MAGDSLASFGQVIWRGLPPALLEIYRRALEMQGFIAGLVILAAVFVLVRGMVQASRIRAGAVVRTAVIARDARLREAARQQVVEESPPTGSRWKPESVPQTIGESLDELRSAVRSALFALMTPDAVIEGRSRMYCERVATRTPPATTLEMHASAAVQIKALVSEVDSLKAKLSVSSDVQTVRDLLVRINKYAKVLQDDLQNGGSGDGSSDAD